MNSLLLLLTMQDGTDSCRHLYRIVLVSNDFQKIYKTVILMLMFFSEEIIDFAIKKHDTPMVLLKMYH